jgi:uncharacterized protein with von Willebrand factor type A (vWA) domain
MPDPRALVRVLDELCWVLRREGFEVSTAQAIDAVRAVAAVGLERRADVRDVIAAVIVHGPRERDRFDAVFDGFFEPESVSHGARTLWERLSARGFDEDELAALRSWLDAMTSHPEDDLPPLAVLLERGPDLDRLLALGGFAGRIDAHSGPQLGFLTHGLLLRIGSGRARRSLAALRSSLVGTLGARGEALVDALAAELEATDAHVRAFVRRTFDGRADELDRQRAGRRLATTPFAALSDAEIEEVRRAVRRFAEGLRGGARVRARRRARRGPIDPHRTLGQALRSGGAPFALVRKARRRDRPKLVLLCDVSESVRAAGCFLLEFTYAVQELFARARSFLFVSELGEATQLFAREPVRIAIARAWSGDVVRGGENSNYGRVLRTFEDRHARDLDRRTTLVILGDGRTNYHDPATEVLERLRRRSRALVWLCTEPRGQWGQGDSAMALYAPRCTSVHDVRCAADLERAARTLVSR